MYNLYILLDFSTIQWKEGAGDTEQRQEAIPRRFSVRIARIIDKLTI
jgi:hypothetical protein